MTGATEPPYKRRRQSGVNTRWFDQPAWNAGWGDSRVQIRPEIKANWIAEMQTSIWAPGDFSNAANEYVLTEHDLTPP